MLSEIVVYGTKTYEFYAQHMVSEYTVLHKIMIIQELLSEFFVFGVQVARAHKNMLNLKHGKENNLLQCLSNEW